MANIISIENLSYTYPESESPAVDNVSLEINKGEWISIVGKNGSGKSTLTRLIDGLLEASSGTISVAGQKLTEESLWDIREKIGIVFQNPDHQFVGATVEDDVAFGLENQGIERDQMVREVDQALKLVDMQDFKNRDPQSLSGGQKQRVAIAGVLAVNPEIIILDESTSMLDPEGRETVLSLVKDLWQNKGMTIISITHDIQETALSQRVVIMKNGHLVEDLTPAQLFVMDDLKQYGLDKPFTTLLKEKLNFDPEYQDEEELISKLWKLN
ncbi:energy-coupling factor transporter ATPase [Companilactobacillus metriopterae]|uniref:energy-coupling factor transporter ATPase n=1 Tax=Companilactobacillus metriopterae TaxID=1909267 RepID=UPI00100A6C9A|nr:energy-coupling factor transporter ATPase [Companilactobacillus metriopterae]